MEGTAQIYSQYLNILYLSPCLGLVIAYPVEILNPWNRYTCQISCLPPTNLTVRKEINVLRNNVIIAWATCRSKEGYLQINITYSTNIKWLSCMYEALYPVLGKHQWTKQETWWRLRGGGENTRARDYQGAQNKERVKWTC